LLHQVEQHVADGRVVALLHSFLTQGVLEGVDRWEPEAGTPQGAVITPPTTWQKEPSSSR
jgi:RNA-directed DNA polymerase